MERLKSCKHNYTTLMGNDYSVNVQVDCERVCKLCGLIGLYSVLEKKWIDVGYIQDDFPEETKNYVIK